MVVPDVVVVNVPNVKVLPLFIKGIFDIVNAVVGTGVIVKTIVGAKGLCAYVSGAPDEKLASIDDVNGPFPKALVIFQLR